MESYGTILTRGTQYNTSWATWIQSASSHPICLRSSEYYFRNYYLVARAVHFLQDMQPRYDSPVILIDLTALIIYFRYIIMKLLIMWELGWRSRYSDWLRAGRTRGQSSSTSRVKNFLFFMSSRLTLGSTQPPIQWLSGALFLGIKWPGHELTTQLHLVPRSRKCGSLHPLSHTLSWRST
jgi:hypothetical protein